MARFPRKVRTIVGRLIGSESKFFFKNSQWLVSSNAVRAVIVFARSIVIARGLGVEKFGTFTVLTTLVITVQEFFNLNVGSTVIKFGADYLAQEQRSELDAVFSLGFWGQLLVGFTSVPAVILIGVASYDLLVQVPGLQLLILILAVTRALAFLEEPCAAALRLFYRFKLNALLNITTAVLSLIFVVVALYLKPGSLTTLILAVAAGSIVRTALLVFSALWELRGGLSLTSPRRVAALRAQWKRTRYFVLGTSGSNTLKRFMNKGDVLLLSALSTPTEVGFYAVGKKIAAMLKVLADPLAMTIYPQIASLVAKRRVKDVKRLCMNGSLSFLVPVLVLIPVMYFFGERLISTGFGADYSESWTVALLVVIAASIHVVLFWSVALLNSLELVGIRFAVYAIASIAGCAVAFVLVDEHGADGMGFAVIAMNAIIQGSFLLAIKRKLGALSVPIKA